MLVGCNDKKPQEAEKETLYETGNDTCSRDGDTPETHHRPHPESAR